MSEQNGMVPVGQNLPANVTARQEFGAQQIVKHGETAATAIAAQAKAEVESRYVMALQRPRDIDTVRVKMLKTCSRTGFAQIARYRKPVGGGAIEGFSIRFAEEAMRCMGNLLPGITAVYDDDKVRIIRVSLTDLENNIYLVKDVVVQKTVERKKLGKGQKPLSSRVNSFGDPTYTVPATDDEILNKENALASKALRNHVLRILPGDIQDECLEQIQATLHMEAGQDPDAQRKKIADAFAAVNVMPVDLKKYLGHDLATASPAELVELRKVHAALKTGETNWTEIMDQRDAEESEKKAEAKGESDPPKSLSDLKPKGAKKPLTIPVEGGEPVEVPREPPPDREPGSDDQ